MEQQVDELYSFLVPLHQDRLIVPRTCVAEVVRYLLPDDDGSSSDWLRGFVTWNQLQVPVINFEALAGLQSEVPGGRTRIAIFQCLADALEVGFFGIATEGFPQLVRVNRDVMEPHDEQVWPDDGPVICQIRMINEYPLIPDLERIELMIQEAITATA